MKERKKKERKKEGKNRKKGKQKEKTERKKCSGATIRDMYFAKLRATATGNTYLGSLVGAKTLSNIQSNLLPQSPRS